MVFLFIRREILYFSLGFAVLTPLVSAGIMLVRKIPAKIGVPAEAGPSATISPSLFTFGVDCIAGFLSLILTWHVRWSPSQLIVKSSDPAIG